MDISTAYAYNLRKKDARFTLMETLDDNRDQFHTVHHKSINFNLGQYLTLWDRLGGTYVDPATFFKPAVHKE